MANEKDQRSAATASAELAARQLEIETETLLANQHAAGVMTEALAHTAPLVSGTPAIDGTAPIDVTKPILGDHTRDIAQGKQSGGAGMARGGSATTDPRTPTKRLISDY